MKNHFTATLFSARLKKTAVMACLFLCFSLVSFAQKLRVVVAGLNHDHVHNILHAFNNNQVTIISIAEPNKQLWAKFGKQYHLPQSLFYTDLKTALQAQKPDAVLGYNEVARHLDVVQLCAPLHIPVMVEKPLAATLDQAKQIEQLANKYQVKVLTNYETTWYASFHDICRTLNTDSIGAVKKLVVHDGHEGPKELGCSPEFLQWLTDPVLNGAGALNDFGCYGANLMTWIMKGQKPIAVTAITRRYKPAVYPKVDDDATVILEYPGATGLIEASWNWPYSIKDLEAFGENGYLHALDGKTIISRKRGGQQNNKQAAPLPAPYHDPIAYLAAVLRNQIPATDDLSSLKYNMIVMQILDAAKRSAASGKRVVL
ncbi:Gfo/Idh/MocA family oxidoreductase [Mucilaginibacter sp. Bleaf8]|uniref:Gfo/Idh/MocA family protein n=1 Tax=Mucilaginibacter sp. Bleaf8 TaxID=2834430 RepID=UPI001BCEC6C7|nr:Gfo/Idh/MocA family oxidoreductase [Mucilaginibacter sp. Bleaf8]MBS7564151.1 Gfo/Idh/MocA family oxidoreductase [Mucilaginibacter sp. Bleaf8]